MRRLLSKLPVVVLVGVFVIGLACGAQASTGSSVGDRVPEFAIRLVDGSTVTDASLMDSDKPAFLFFFATWCGVCRAELQSIQSIYPDFGDEVAFFAIGQDSSESLAKLEQYRASQGHPWPVAETDSKMLSDFRVVQQSTKIAVGANGIIIYRAGYGRGGPDTWRQVFRELTESAVQ